MAKKSRSTTSTKKRKKGSRQKPDQLTVSAFVFAMIKGLLSLQRALKLAPEEPKLSPEAQKAHDEVQKEREKIEKAEKKAAIQAIDIDATRARIVGDVERLKYTFDVPARSAEQVAAVKASARRNPIPFAAGASALVAGVVAGGVALTRR